MNFAQTRKDLQSMYVDFCGSRHDGVVWIGDTATSPEIGDICDLRTRSCNMACCHGSVVEHLKSVICAMMDRGLIASEEAERFRQKAEESWYTLRESDGGSARVTQQIVQLQLSPEDEQRMAAGPGAQQKEAGRHLLQIRDRLVEILDGHTKGYPLPA